MNTFFATDLDSRETWNRKVLLSRGWYVLEGAPTEDSLVGCSDLIEQSADASMTCGEAAPSSQICRRSLAKEQVSE